MKLFKKICSIDGCENHVFCRELCPTHYIRWQRNKPMMARTIYTPNEFTVDGDVCRIGLYGKNGNRIAETIIDAEDVEKCRGMKWSLNKQGYSIWMKERIPLQRHILGIQKKKGCIVDHINMDKLDNRKSNLRLCSHRQNLWNMPKRKDNTSGYKGVYWVKRLNKWCSAYMKENGHTKFVGNFKDIEDAVSAYNESVKQDRGKFAYLNAVGE